MTDPTNEPGHPLVLSDGEHGRALDYTQGVLQVVCGHAYPPGQPLSLTLELHDGDAITLQGKCAGSRLREDGRFEVKLRLHSLRREQRAALEELFG